jgi:hypothetical protein
MKRISLIVLMFLAAAGVAVAQKQAPTSDVLGAHLNYGRGCAGCHAPHSGAMGQGIKSTDTLTGNVALWGEDVGPLVGKTILTGGGSYSETLPAVAAGGAEVSGILMCLSCHDGNYATGAMMKNSVYESVPSTYTSKNIPTLLGNDGTTTGNYMNDHPVGINAIVGCGGQYNWDCTSSAGTITLNGTLSSQFVQNYGFFTKPSAIGGNPVVVCTTCHNQHLMNVVKVTNGATSGLPSGYYATMFFIKAPYNPASGTAGSNQTAQFCRQCHGGEANEMNGASTANGANIATTF